MEQNFSIPKPGSDEAIADGCKCPVLNNGHGRGHLGEGGKFGWWVNENCPIHGTAVEFARKKQEKAEKSDQKSVFNKQSGEQ